MQIGRQDIQYSQEVLDRLTDYLTEQIRANTLFAGERVLAQGSDLAFNAVIREVFPDVLTEKLDLTLTVTEKPPTLSVRPNNLYTLLVLCGLPVPYELVDGKDKFDAPGVGVFRMVDGEPRFAATVMVHRRRRKRKKR